MLRLPVSSRALSQITGAQVFLKFENLQFTASFKGVARLTTAHAQRRGARPRRGGDERERHAQAWPITHSAGSAPSSSCRFTPGVKVEHTRLWCRVVLHGDTLAEARTLPAGAGQQRLSSTYDDEAIAAGRARWRWRCCRPSRSGCAGRGHRRWRPDCRRHGGKAIKPGIEVVGVRSTFPSMVNALRQTDLPMGTSTMPKALP